MITEDYKEYLNSPQWAKIRNKVLQRDDFKCSICGSYRGLQVHHLNYNHFKNEENYLEDLMTVCNECHEKIENQKKEQDRRIFEDYLEEKEKLREKQEREYWEKWEKQQNNFKTFINDNEADDLSNIGKGKLNFCDFTFLKEFTLEKYGEDFYNNLKKLEITNYFGNKRNLVIAKMLINNYKDYQILQFGFTPKRVKSVKQMINDFSKYDDIFEFMEHEYNKKIYGGTVNSKIVKNFINMKILKDKNYNKDVLLDNFNIILNWYELLEIDEHLSKPKLGDD